ncbi:MAG: DUF3159 domain-containing protein [Actinomycetota bacterium]|nr:DUF3159 domain-containing protein [Actinomycetota bacterium]
MNEAPQPVAAVVQERFSIAEAIGGGRGLLDAGLPGIVFVTVYTITRSLTAAVWGAIAAGALLTAVRLARRETVQHALAGFVGVAIAAFIAQRTGRAENFFLPGLFINAGYALAYLVSILVRWPLLGLFVGAMYGQGTAWRRDPAQLRAFTLASWVWVAMFCLRIAVQWPLYLAGALVPLGVARLAMGWPLFLLAVWISWLLLRPVSPRKTARVD